MSTRILHPRLAFALCIFCAIFLLACGGSDSSEEESEASQTIVEEAAPPPPPPPPAAKKRSEIREIHKAEETEEEFHKVEPAEVVVINEVEFVPHRFSYSDPESSEPLHVNMKAFDIPPIFGKKCPQDDTPDDCSHDAIQSYLRNRIKYPDEAKNFDDIVEYVTFTVNPDGSVDGSNILILPQEPQCHTCAAEALQLVRGMPKWTPAQKGGQAVESRVTIPIRFDSEAG